MRIIILITTALLMLFHTGIKAADKDNKPFVVVLDPGHGGKDPGAIGSSRSNMEKKINLNIALEVGRLLKSKSPDVKVIFTRDRDVFVPLGDRANIANKSKANLFISIHTNALPKGARRAMGVQSYTLSLKTAATNLEVEKRENSVIQFEENGAQRYSFNNPNSSESDIIFELMQDRDMKESVNFATMVQREMVNEGGRRDMGVLQANLAVLRLSYMPSVLLEVGYISTPEEERYLMSKRGQTTLAKCIYNAIAKYKQQHTGRMANLEKIDIKDLEDEDEDEADNKKEEKKAKDDSRKADKDNDMKADRKSVDKDKDDVPVFKVQIMATDRKLKKNDRQLKGLYADYYKENGMYKYTCGETEDYNEILHTLKDVKKKFPGAFVVAFKDDERVETASAIREFKTNRKQYK